MISSKFNPKVSKSSVAASSLAVAACLLFLTMATCKPIGKNKFSCDQVACDTIDTYQLRQFCADTTIDYELTYTDTILLVREDGELSFSISQCRNCIGQVDVPMVNEFNEIVDTVQVNYAGDGSSNRVNVKSLSSSSTGIIRMDWRKGGKVFYIKLR